jgi:hypothetical protein
MKRPVDINEHVMWCNCLRYSDPIYRFDETGDIRSELIRAGGEVVHFWRGLAEGLGSLNVCTASHDCPYVQLKASKLMLWTLIEWMYDRNPGGIAQGQRYHSAGVGRSICMA